MALGECFRIERENSALEGLRLLPVDPRALFLGKALGNAAVLIGLAFVLVPVMVGLFGVSISLGFGPLALTLVLGCLAISAPGTLYSAVASNARARDVLLPLLLFPLIIPALLAAAQAGSLGFPGEPMSPLRFLVWLLVGVELVY